MMKKNNVLIVSISLMLLVSLSFNIYQHNKVKSIEGNTLTKKEYYNKLEKRMFDYYKIMFRSLNISENEKYNYQMLTLKQLESAEFPMEEFVSYDGKEKCNTTYSYAVRTYENGRYRIKVYFNCGDDANYKMKNNK